MIDGNVTVAERLNLTVTSQGDLLVPSPARSILALIAGLGRETILFWKTPVHPRFSFGTLPCPAHLLASCTPDVYTFLNVYTFHNVTILSLAKRHSTLLNFDRKRRP
jgi:hypothetical protein